MNCHARVCSFDNHAREDTQKKPPTAALWQNPRPARDSANVDRDRNGDMQRGGAHGYLSMAGLAIIDQNNSIEATTPIVTAFKFCIRHRKNGLLNRLPFGS
jgi:hypothetical protein